MQHLEEIIANATTAIDTADSLVALDEVRVQYLGKKGELTSQLQSLGKLPPDKRSPLAKTRCNVPSLKRNWLKKLSM
jgi:phenylalanyl-tRNA synthetase alpha subunit